MTAEELRKNAGLSQDALDQANLKLALMQFDAKKIDNKNIDTFDKVHGLINFAYIVTVIVCAFCFIWLVSK